MSNQKVDQIIDNIVTTTEETWKRPRRYGGDKGDRWADNLDVRNINQVYLIITLNFSNGQIIKCTLFNALNLNI